MNRRRANRRWAPAAAGAGLLVAAWCVAALTPPDSAAEQPFVVSAPVGDRGEGRNLAVTVTVVRLADAVTNEDWQAEGEWLVVDLEAEAAQSDVGAALNRATLEFGGRRFGASERPPDSLLRHPLTVGVPLAGGVAFELPAGSLSEAAGDEQLVLRFGLDTDERLDSVIETRVRLDEVERVSEVELAPSGWAGV